MLESILVRSRRLSPTLEDELILVAGGSGFIGSYIVRTLVADGYSVRILSRNPKSSPLPDQIETVRGDVTSAATIPPAMEGCETVVMAAQFSGHPVERPRKNLTYDAVDRVGTENLLEAATESDVKRFIYISGAGVGRGRSEEWFVAKARAEDAVKNSGLDWMVIRPSWCYGPEDKALNRIARIATWLPVVPVLGWNHQYVMPIFVGDVASAVARAVATAGVWNATYEIGGPDVMTMKEVVETALAVMHRRRLLLPVPKPLMKLAALPISLLPNAFLSPRAVDFATGDAIVDNGPIQNALGIKVRSLEEGLRTYM